MNITVYLGASSGNDPTLETSVRALGRLIGESGNALVYGGSKNGLMGALAESVLRAGGDVTGGNSQFYFVTALPDSVSSSDRQAELTANGYTDAQIAAYAAVGGLPYLDNTDTVFGQVYQGMDVVDAMACVDTVKDDDGNDTYRPTEEAAITINSVTITTYSSAEDNGLDTVG